VVVDDDSDHVEVMTRLLARAGAQVISVNHPGQAIATIAGILPDLAIIDIMMPGLDGLTLLRKVRTLSPEKGGQVPALILTADTLCAHRRLEWERAGFQGCMSKPLVPDVFLKAVDRLTGTSVERRRTEPEDPRWPVHVDHDRRREHRSSASCRGFEVIAGLPAERRGGRLDRTSGTAD
jgi:CheY-like chemotaxis protein